MRIQNGVGTWIVFMVLSYLYKLSSASSCSSLGLAYLSKSYDQLLTNPSYPFNYPPRSNCLWSIQRPSSSYAVQLKFSIFLLESKTSCTDDYVEIRDGDLQSTSKLIGKFCGSRLPPIIVSNYKYIFVKFVSDYDYYPSTRKFVATYRYIVPVRSSSKCQSNSPFLHNNNLQLSFSSSGTFSSPSYPSYYPNSMLCTWKLTAPVSKRIKLTFSYFRLESGSCSSNDYLEIRDGSSSTSLKKGTYCGSYAPTITSSGRYMWLRFRSDAQLSYKGFQARYEVVSKSSSMAGTVVGVIVGIGIVVVIIAVVIYLIKRKNRRVVTNQAVTTTTTTTTVAANQPPPVGYAQPNPQQYPQAAGPPPGPPAGMQPGPPPPGHPNAYPQAGSYPQAGPPTAYPPNAYPQPGPYNAAPGMPMNPGYAAYPPPQASGAVPPTQAPPPYYQTKPGPTTVEL